MTPDPRSHMKIARTVVLKVGSSLLVDPNAHRLRESWLEGLAQDVALLHRRGQRVLLVSSGAIALGRRVLGYGDRPLPLERSQAAAAVGQILLAQAYAARLAPFRITSAQVLLTLGDTQDRRRYLNARATLEALLEARAVPVINENDTVATDEIRYGDNDRLASRVALMAGADLLVMLSDIDGLYTADPRIEPGASRIDCIREITPEMLSAAGATGNATARGGMHTKLLAAQSAMQGGCVTAIAEGRGDRPVRRLERDATGSWFWPNATPRAARKQWIAAMKPLGWLEVDSGAAGALRNGKSLLPVGVVEVGGSFERGDPVEIRTPGAGAIGAGLCAYSVSEARRIKGRPLRAVPEVLGYAGRGALVHRDDMVLWSVA